MRIFLITILLLLSSKFVFAETIIYCPDCRQQIYTYKNDNLKKGEELNKEDFLPILKSVNKIRCPKCGSYINGWEYFMDNQGYKSFTLAYNAVSLLTKNKEDKWVWFPCDIPMLNFNEVK